MFFRLSVSNDEQYNIKIGFTSNTVLLGRNKSSCTRNAGFCRCNHLKQCRRLHRWECYKDSSSSVNCCCWDNSSKIASSRSWGCDFICIWVDGGAAQRTLSSWQKLQQHLQASEANQYNRSIIAHVNNSLGC